jgi:hypothetical protein
LWLFTSCCGFLVDFAGVDLLLLLLFVGESQPRSAPKRPVLDRPGHKEEQQRKKIRWIAISSHQREVDRISYQARSGSAMMQLTKSSTLCDRLDSDSCKKNIIRRDGQG